VAKIHYPHQRSGWAYAQQSLTRLLREDGGGVLLDTMLEQNFGRRLDEALRDGRVPYRRPWVGMLHMPPRYPAWFDQRKRFEVIRSLPCWEESVEFCRGLVVLSRQMREWLGPQVSVPVAALQHPTETAALTFDFDAYRRAGEPVVQVGWWLRRLASIHWLPLPARRKFLLLPHDDKGLDRFQAAVAAEQATDGAPRWGAWDVTILKRLCNPDYDALLAHAVVFLHLHASVANNAIVECIVRRTPVLVNPLPSVREYLGDAYPLYFETLEEAAAKASDPDLVRATHEYLAGLDRTRFDGETFCRALADSALYRAL
jgi:hypothetical protein